MMEHDPKQFIKDYLTLPLGSDEPGLPPPENSWVGGRSGYPWRGAGK